MNTYQIKFSSVVRVAMMLLLTVFTTPGVWAQTPISDESSLKGALRNGANLQLTADIVLEKYLDIDNMTVTIDLNGHSLSRSLSEHNSAVLLRKTAKSRTAKSRAAKPTTAVPSIFRMATQ